MTYEEINYGRDVEVARIGATPRSLPCQRPFASGLPTGQRLFPFFTQANSGRAFRNCSREGL